LHWSQTLTVSIIRIDIVSVSEALQSHSMLCDRFTYSKRWASSGCLWTQLNYQLQ